MNIQLRSARHRNRIHTKYHKKVLRLGPIAYWPLWEPSGSVAQELVNGWDGAYTGVSLGHPGIGDGKTCPFFDGTTAFVDVYTTLLRDAFSGAEGTLMIWAKVYDVGVWTDSADRYTIHLRADADNFIQLARKHSTNNTLFSRYAAAATPETQADTAHGGTLTWMQFAITWSKAAEQVKHIVNGAQWGATDVTLGIWAGNLIDTATIIGALATTPTAPWHGWLAHAALWDTPLPLKHLAKLAVIR